MNLAPAFSSPALYGLKFTNNSIYFKLASPVFKGRRFVSQHTGGKDATPGFKPVYTLLKAISFVKMTDLPQVKDNDNG